MLATIALVAVAVWLAGAVLVLAALAPKAETSRDLAVVAMLAVGWPVVVVVLAVAMLSGGEA